MRSSYTTPVDSTVVQGPHDRGGQLRCRLPEPTVQQILKALAVQKAFQQVLDTPGAAEALQQPALKPLLDQAAD